MKKYFVFVMLILLLSVPILQAEDYRALNDRGVQAYQHQNYDSSVQYFKDAQDEQPENKVIDFNLGNALHQQGEYKDALQNYENATNSDDSSLAAEAYYNIGNTQYRSGQLDKAIEAYKKSLDYDPRDKDTKYNLELAMKMKEQQEQKQQQNQDQQDKDQDKQDQNKQDQQNKDQQNKDQQQNQDQQKQDQKDQQQKQDQQKQDEQKKDQQDQKQQDQQQNKQDEQNQQEQQQNQGEQGDQKDQQNAQQNQGQPSEQQPAQLDEKRAEALLEGLNQDEKEVLKELLKKKAGVSAYNGKNW